MGRDRPAARPAVNDDQARATWPQVPRHLLPGSRQPSCRRAASAAFDRPHGGVSTRTPYQEAVGQVPPGAPGPVQVQDRLDDRPQRPDPRPAAPPGHLSGQVRGDDLPLGIGQVTGIAPGPLSGPGRIPWACAGPAVFGLHISRNTVPAPAHLSTPATAPTWHHPATTGTSGHLSNTH